MAEDHSGHRERLKRRFRKEGIDSFEPHNVLELLLFYSIPRRDTNVIAHRLIDTFGSLDKVLEADFRDLCNVEGVGENTATLIKLVLGSYRAYEQQKEKAGFVASSAEATKKYCVSCFVGESREKCYLLCLDNSLKLINRVLISEGTTDSANISIRKVVEVVTQNKATAAILTHNHPTGDIMASTADYIVTRKVFDALAMIGVELTDHIIVAGRNAISLATYGVLEDYKK